MYIIKEFPTFSLRNSLIISTCQRSLYYVSFVLQILDGYHISSILQLTIMNFDLSIVVNPAKEAEMMESNERKVMQIKWPQNSENNSQLSAEQQIMASLATVQDIETVVVSTGLLLPARQKIANMFFQRDGCVPCIRR